MQALCKHFPVCGGCTIQNIKLHGEYKIEKLKSALAKINFTGILHPLFQVLPRTRRRANFKVFNNKLSFNKLRSKELVTIDDCLLLKDQLNQLIIPINQLLKSLKKISAVSMTSSDSGIELVFHTESSSELSVDQRLIEFAKLHNIARIAWHIDKNYPYTVIELQPVGLKFGYIEVDLPINSFLQVTKESSDFMAELIIKYLDLSKKVMELYCGCGSFTVPIAVKAKAVIAFEGNEQAIKALNKAVSKFNLNITAKTRDLYFNPLRIDELRSYSQVIINPPRNGATPQIKQISECPEIKKVILVSCSVENFIRDSKILLNKGFSLKEIYPVDQFLYSEHLELVAIFIT